MQRNQFVIDLKRLETLPTLPVVAVNLMNLAFDEHTDAAELSRLIATDQAISLKLLKVSNSPFYRREREVANLQDAVVLLGRKTLQSLVLSITVVKLFDKESRSSGFDYDRHWTHCLATAQTAKHIASRLRLGNPETCYVAGLLHDVGKLALEVLYPEQYREVLEEARTRQQDLLSVEEDLLDVTHAAVGKWVLERWKLPQPIIEAVWLHHHDLPVDEPDGEGPRMAAVVNLSNALCNAEGYTTNTDIPTLALSETNRTQLGLAETELVSIADAVAVELPKLTDALQLPPPTRTEYADYLERSNQALGKINLEAEQAKAALEYQTQQLTKLCALSTSLLSKTEVDEVAETLAVSVLESLSVARVCCSVTLGESAVLVAEAFSREQDEPVSKVFVSNDSEQADELHGGSAARVELTANGKSLGTMSITRSADDDRRQDLGTALATYANIGALAIDNTIARFQLADRAEKLVVTSRQLRKTESDLATINHQVERIERLKVLGEMVAGIVHDFNNALTVLHGSTKLLSLKCQDETLRTHVQIIEQTVDDASHIIARLGAYSRQPRAVQRELVDLNGIVEDILVLMEGRLARRKPAKDTIEVEKRLGPLHPISAGASELREAVMNLVINAIDSMPGGGRLTLSTLEQNGAIVLSIADTGVGMPPEVRERAFESFFTTKGDEGTGLGLTMTRDIISRYGGKITLDSKENAGTTVRVSFAATQGAVAEPRRTMPALPSRRVKVLISEPDEQLARVLEQILAQHGYEVEFGANDGDADSPPVEAGYDLIITDTEAGEDRSLELAAAHKRRSPACRVLLLAHGDLLGDSPLRGQTSVDHVLQKPFQMQQFLHAVATLLSTDS